MAEMNVVRAADNGFEALWSSFCLRERPGHYYLPTMRRVYAEVCRDRLIADLSFAVASRGDPVAVVPLILERGEFGPQFASRDGYLPAWRILKTLESRQRKKVLAVIRETLDALVREHGIRLYKCLVEPFLAFEAFAHHNYLLEEGFLDCSTSTRVIPLTGGLDEVWGGVRKSFRPIISKGMKLYRVHLVDHAGGDPDMFRRFKELYALAAGREVHSPECWEMLFEAVRNDAGMLVLVMKEEVLIGGNLFLHLGGKAYYAFGANHPDHEQKECAGHCCLWGAVEYYLSRGFDFLEAGWQELSPQFSHVPGPKETDIAFFKRGFGGVDVPLFRGIKFFDHDAGRRFIRNQTGVLLHAMR